MPDPEQPPPAVSVSGPAGAVLAGMGWASKLTERNVVVIGCLVSMVVISGMNVYQTWLGAEERKSDREERREQYAAGLRSAESKDEAMRRHCAEESRALRQFFSDRDKDQIRATVDREATWLKHQADERAKDRAVSNATIEMFQKWREMLGPVLKKPGIEEPLPETAIAPVPRLKRNGSNN